jgi:signal transduction histidine kinase
MGSAHARQRPEGDAARLHGPRACILVADDDPTASLLAHAALEQAGFDPVCVQHGAAALERFEAGGIDLVVLDVEMPVLDGFAACRAIRARTAGAHVPILIVTGRDDLDSIDAAYEAGANDFVTKPVAWTVFCQRIRYMLRASDAFERVRESHRLAEEANSAKRKFLARASHELRTPLHSILGFLEVLESAIREFESNGAEVSATCEESAHTIRKNAEHLLRLVEDLLDLSKIEAGRFPLKIARFSVAELMTHLKTALLPDARQRSVDLVTLVDAAAMSLESDATRVRQILTNLAVNAIRCAPGGRVEVLASPWGQGGVEFEVRDTGIGMTPEQLQQAFEPFTQGDDPATQGHAGLGLTVVRELTQALEGSLSASSEPRRGTTVCVRLPALPGSQSPVRLAGAENPSLRSSRVLVVDDGRDNRRLLDLVLRKAGIHVTLACDGREGVSLGLESLRSGNPFDVVLMDLQMPHLDGLQALVELRRAGYTRPIVALTANTVQGEQERSLSSGFDGFLTKPIDSGALLRNLAGWIAKARHDGS